MIKYLVSLVLLAFVAGVGAQVTIEDIKVVPPASKAATEMLTETELVSSCSVTFENGMTTEAVCKGRIAVIDPRGKLQCAPRANLVKKGGYYFFMKSPKDTGERVKPCKDGDKVQS